MSKTQHSAKKSGENTVIIIYLCGSVGHFINRRVGAAGKAGSYRHVAVSHGTTSSTFCRYRHGKTDAAMMHRRLFHKPMRTPRRLCRLYPTCCRLPGADKVGFLPISAGKRRAPPSSAVDRLISWCVSVTVVADYCWCASVTSHHGPAKPAFCRYRQEKLVSCAITCSNWFNLWRHL